MIIKRYLAFSVALIPLVSWCMQQQKVDEQNFSFRAGNTFNKDEVVAVRNEEGLVMGIITMKQPFTKNRYVVQVSNEKTPYPASSIGKLKENMNVWERMKSTLSRSTQPKPTVSKKVPDKTKKENPEHEAHVVLGFGAADKITSEQLEQNYKTQLKEAKKERDATTRKAREKLIKSSYNALKHVTVVQASQDLLMAVASGNLEAVNKALNAGADINVRNNYGQTALMSAADRGHIYIVRLLLDRGADINAQDEYGLTALRWATNRGHVEMVRLLLDKGADFDACIELMIASGDGRVDIARLLLDKGVDVNARLSKEGYRVLMHAAATGHVEIVSFFLERGADINAQDDKGHTALTKAVWRSNTKIVRLLLDRGADVNIKDNEGHTMLMGAVVTGHRDIVSLLLDRGVYIDAQDNYGRTALMYAVVNGHTGIVSLLLDRGADVNVRNKKEETVFSLAKSEAIKGMLQTKLNTLVTS